MPGTTEAMQPPEVWSTSTSAGNKEPLDPLQSIEHNGIQYTVVQTANPLVWRWMVRLEGMREDRNVAQPDRGGSACTTRSAARLEFDADQMRVVQINKQIDYRTDRPFRWLVDQTRNDPSNEELHRQA